MTDKPAEQPAALESDAKTAIELQRQTIKEIKSLNTKIAWLVFFAVMSFLGALLTFLNDFMRAF